MKQLPPHDAAWAAEITERVLKSCHPKQRDFVVDPGRRVAALVGRGGGKTTAQVARLIIKMVSTPRARCVFVATTKEHARDLIWDKLKDSLTRLGIEAKFNEVRQTCEIKRNGARLKLTGADDNREVDKLRGLSFHEVAIDEAASHEHRLLEKLVKRIVGPRLGEFGGCICLLGTPGHDLRGMFYEATFPGLRDKLNIPTNRPYEDRDKPEYDIRHEESRDYRPAIDKDGSWTRWSSHHWTILSGAPFIKALRDELAENLIEKEANGWGDDHPVWQREYLGRWAADDTEMMFKYRPQVDGRDWNVWNPDRDQLGFAKMPDGPDGKPRQDWLYAYGFDMGHSDPFALVVLAFSPTDTTRTIYHVYSFEKPKMYARPIAQLLLGADEKSPTGCCKHSRPEGVFKATGWPIGMVADMTHLGGNVLLELQNVYGIMVTAAEQKGKFAAVELFNGDLIEGRLKILKGSVLEDQLSRLQWQPDEFGRLKEPKGVANHCFVAGTMVMTEHGERPIESVRAGDLVWTRHGLHPVAWSGQTGTRETWRCDLSTGRSLVGTADHRIWTDNGWVELSLLTPDATLTTWESTDRASLSCFGERSTAGIRMPTTHPWPGTSPHPTGNSSIAQSTQRFEAPYRSDSISTTRTATTPTIESETSKPSMGASTSARTCGHLSGVPSRLASSSPTLSRLPVHGTRATKAGSGTASTRAALQQDAARFSVGVRSAESGSGLSYQPLRCAAGSVTPGIDGPAAQTTSATSANIADLTSCGTATRGRLGSVHCVASTPTGRSEPVYDLTIDGPPEFFANGVLVHNSADAAIYCRRLVAHMFTSTVPSTSPQTAQPQRAQTQYAEPAEVPDVPIGLDLEEPDWGNLYK